MYGEMETGVARLDVEMHVIRGFIRAATTVGVRRPAGRRSSCQGDDAFAWYFLSLIGQVGQVCCYNKLHRQSCRVTTHAMSSVNDGREADNRTLRYATIGSIKSYSSCSSTTVPSAPKPKT